MPNKLTLGVLISGRGSNLQALIKACKQPSFPAEIGLVISNKAAAGGLELAKAAGIATQVFNHKDFPDRISFDAQMTKALKNANVQLVCLAGFMRLVSEEFVANWHNKLINIHPSLLPHFKGLDAQAQAIDAGAKESGCTVHFVRKEMDSGPIILQKTVPVLADDTVESLSARILEQEHIAYPEAVNLIASGKLTIEGDTITL